MIKWRASDSDCERERKVTLFGYDRDGVEVLLLMCASSLFPVVTHSDVTHYVMYSSSITLHKEASQLYHAHFRTSQQAEDINLNDCLASTGLFALDNLEDYLRSDVPTFAQTDLSKGLSSQQVQNTQGSQSTIPSLESKRCWQVSVTLKDNEISFCVVQPVIWRWISRKREAFSSCKGCCCSESSITWLSTSNQPRYHMSHCLSCITKTVEWRAINMEFDII